MAKTTKFERQLKKVNTITIILVLLFAILGVAGGFGTAYFLTQKDVFKINGETEITLNVGDTYEELGATAIAFGKDVSSEVVISGAVDTSTEGRYVIKYTIDNFRFNGYVLYKLVVVEPIGE